MSRRGDHIVSVSVFGIRYDFCIKINLITSKLAQDQKVRAPWLYTLEVLMSTKFSGRCLFDSLQRSGVISLVRVRMRTSLISRLPTQGTFTSFSRLGNSEAWTRVGWGRFPWSTIQDDFIFCRVNLIFISYGWRIYYTSFVILKGEEKKKYTRPNF